MFGFRRRETPPLQVYGKLPLAKDYLRLGLGEGDGLLLRDWLDGAFSGNAVRQTAVLAGPLRFVVGDAWNGCLQGLLQPSSDAGGLRSFPFVLAVERQRRAVVDDLGNGLAVAGAVWRDLAGRWEQRARFADGRALLAGWRGAEVEVASLRPAPASAVDVDAWVEALWPASGRSGLEQDLGALAALPPAEPVRLPLVRGCSQRQQVSAWLELLGRLGGLAADTCPTLFFPASERGGTDAAAGPASVVVFRAPARPADGSWLAACGTEPLGPGDLAAARPAAAVGAQPTTEGAPSLASSLRLTVTNYLRRRAGER